jgi:hypothetical protein
MGWLQQIQAQSEAARREDQRVADERLQATIERLTRTMGARSSRDADTAADRSRPSDEKLRMSDIACARKDLTQFKGGAVTRVEVDDFLGAQEHFANLSYHDDARFLAHMRTQLLGGARTWFDTLSPAPDTRVKFVKSFRERWYPVGGPNATRKALQELRMNGTTAEFISSWRSLMADMTALVAASAAEGNQKAAMPSGDELLEWFKDGLRGKDHRETSKRAKQLYVELRTGLRFLSMADPPKEPTVHDAASIVEKADKDIPDVDKPSDAAPKKSHKREAEVSAASSSDGPLKRQRNNSTRRIAPASKDTPDSEVHCFNCGKKGHRIAACKAPLVKSKALVHAVALDHRCYGDQDVEAFQVAHAGVDAEPDATAPTDDSSEDEADFQARA